MDEVSLTMPSYQLEDEIFVSLVHIALKLGTEIMSHPNFNGFSVSDENAIACVPNSLYIFLMLLYGGESVLEEEGTENIEEGNTRTKVLNVAQDLVYGITDGKKWTPKHVGLAMTLHQATRSQDLVRLFHKAELTLSYEQVLRVGTALAENTLESIDYETGTVIPTNL